PHTTGGRVRMNLPGRCPERTPKTSVRRKSRTRTRLSCQSDAWSLSSSLFDCCRGRDCHIGGTRLAKRRGFDSCESPAQFDPKERRVKLYRKITKRKNREGSRSISLLPSPVVEPT